MLLKPLRRVEGLAGWRTEGLEKVCKGIQAPVAWCARTARSEGEELELGMWSWSPLEEPSCVGKKPTSGVVP